MILEYLKLRYHEYKRKQYKLSYKDGWDYAAGELLRGKSPRTMQAEYDKVIDCDLPFDHGMEDATEEFIKLTGVEDDRVQVF
jgi:hypothetical protein